MITNKQIKEIVAPKLKAIRAAGFNIRYMDGSAVVLANKKYGIKLKFHSDLDGWVETDLNTESLTAFRQNVKTPDELLKRFSVTLSVEDITKLMEKSI